MLTVGGLSVDIGERRVLRSVDLQVGAGELHVLFGPNGSGKTALLMALMGVPRYRVVAGTIQFMGEDVTALPPNERAARGMALFHQRPPTVDGLTLREIAGLAQRGSSAPLDLDELAARMRCEELLDRNLNVGFSGGESKLAELLQLIVQQPRLALLDEPDSGVDADNLVIVGEALAGLLADRRRSAILITHAGSILDHLEPSHAHLLLGGRIVKHGQARALLHDIREHGYEGAAT